MENAGWPEDKKAPKQPRQKIIKAPVDLEEYEPNWKTDDFSRAFKIARSENKLLFLYCYFKDKEDLATNYDANLQEYSQRRAVFAKILVRTDSKGEVVDDEIIEFYKKHKLPKGAMALVLDRHGNLIEKLAIPAASNKITAAIDNADKKTADLEKDLTRRWEKVKELQKKEKPTEVIRELNAIIKTGWEGYEVFLDAQAEIDKLDKPYAAKYREFVKQYLDAKKEDLSADEVERNKDVLVRQLEVLAKEAKDLPAEATAKEAVACLKKNELPPLVPPPVGLDEEKPAEEEK